MILSAGLLAHILPSGDAAGHKQCTMATVSSSTADSGSFVTGNKYDADGVTGKILISIIKSSATQSFLFRLLCSPILK